MKTLNPVTRLAFGVAFAVAIATMVTIGAAHAEKAVVITQPDGTTTTIFTDPNGDHRWYNSNGHGGGVSGSSKSLADLIRELNRGSAQPLTKDVDRMLFEKAAEQNQSIPAVDTSDSEQTVDIGNQNSEAVDTDTDGDASAGAATSGQHCFIDHMAGHDGCGGAPE